MRGGEKMARSLAKLWIGLDWGTHSSKWWYTAEDENGTLIDLAKADSVVDSSVYRRGDSVFLVHEGGLAEKEVADRRLKRLLLKDPQGASYWDAAREGIRMSLGEAAALSLAALLGDVAANLEANGLLLTEKTVTELRYSLPNWIAADVEHRTARRRMFQTTLVVSAMLEQVGLRGLPRVGQDIDVATWRQQIEHIRKNPECHEMSRAGLEQFAELVAGEFRIGRTTWRLAAESSAAGFPSLLNLLMPEEEARSPQDHWVKLLVVDVGAGSTDAGYFISSRRVDGELLLHYLKPALTLDYAGEQLTEMLREHYFRQKYREITIPEAETLKISAPDQWSDETFADDWRGRIARSVADYMFRVPDELRLGETAIPGLKIVMTGGSGLVEGLAKTVRDQVEEALARRGVPGNVAARTQVTSLPSNSVLDPVDQARRAVSVGAGTWNFAQLAYRAELPRAIRARGGLETWRG